MSELPGLPEPVPEPGMGYSALFTDDQMREYALQAVAGYKADAERYRWLRDFSPTHILRELFDGPITDAKHEAQLALDVAIDAARKERR